MSTAVFRYVVDCIWNLMAHEQKNHISSLQPNGQVHLKRHWVSVQSNAGSRGVRISGSNAGCSMFRGSVKGTGYPPHSTVSLFTSPPVRHRVPSHFNCPLKLSAHNTPTVSPQHKPRTTTLTLYSSQHFLFVSHRYISVFCSPEIVCLSSGQYPTCVNLTESSYHLLRLFHSKAVAYPGMLGWVYSTNSVEDRGQREQGYEAVTP